jgi:hypothetical protein
MKSILFSKISNKNGLTEQVFSLINSIIVAKELNRKIVVMESRNYFIGRFFSW